MALPLLSDVDDRGNVSFPPFRPHHLSRHTLS